MIRVSIKARVLDSSPHAVYGRLCDFSQYASLTEVVRHVRVTPSGAGSITSDWAINFRGGVLEWQEHDELDVVALQIRFRQLSGDLKSFHGAWSVRAAGPDAEIDFDAQADLGIPSLAPLLEPAAERALTQASQQILTGLFGPSLVLSSQATAAE